MLTTVQVRAMLDIAGWDPASIQTQLSVDTQALQHTEGYDSEGVELATLLGFLTRQLARELRETVTSGADIAAFLARMAACSPQGITLEGQDTLQETTFAAVWLDEWVSAVLSEASSPEHGQPLTPRVAEAASEATLGVKVLLEYLCAQRAEHAAAQLNEQLAFAVERLCSAGNLAAQIRNSAATPDPHGGNQA